MKNIINFKQIACAVIISIPFSAQAQLADSTQRLVPVKGAVNFRDAGGYKTTDGKTVKWNKVFRSAAIDKLTAEDMEVISAKKMYTVVDFRGTKEAAAAPDKLLPGAQYTLCPAGSDNLPDAAQMITLIKQGGFLEKMYGKEGVQYFGDRYKPMFQQLLNLNDTAALLFHCTGGRDRTGMANALFLYAMGVPQATIEADFVASNAYLGKSMSQMLSGLAKASGLPQEKIEAEMQLRPELIRLFFGSIKEKYGSIENFFDKELGIDKKGMARLRRMYTE
ncbi:tyrosine-protein phosphatase [Edaphocola aurantiacus]|uniref:tyrosine-protein phosphatase n=1 Tax=Edaphocola aurantiacus TaxID=2601682 RepID=UPI001C962EED|nr:tyrosine-protein phosphatase [Edaphocola aurantiacus]